MKHMLSTANLSV